MAGRLLGAAHFLVVIPLLLFSTMFGFVLAPFLALGPVWLGFIGIQLWRGPTRERYQLVRKTHLLSLPIAGLLCLYGISALRAAERSAAAGGGLLGAFGLIPLGMGIVLAALSGASLAVVRRKVPPN